MRWILPLIYLALQSACTLSGSLPCANDSECTEGLRCSDRFCVAIETPDASMLDVVGVDAIGPDAFVSVDVSADVGVARDAAGWASTMVF